MSAAGPPIRAAVLTVSDRCSRGEQEDRSGPAVSEFLRTRLGAEIAAVRTLPDEIEPIAACFAAWVRDAPPIDLIVSTGGTGLAPRDITPEAAKRVIERECAPLMELARLRAFRRTEGGRARAYLSRGVAGAAGRSLIITLPGSPRGACETLDGIAELIPHAVALLRESATDHP